MNSEADFIFLHKAVELALEAEKVGNLPIGSVITFNNEIIAAAGNSMLLPHFDPGRHAEMNALDLVPVHLWKHAAEMTCYTTLEPCCMCFSRMLLSGIGRIVYGATDTQGGFSCLTSHLPPFYHAGNTPVLTGPLLPEICDPLFERAKQIFNQLEEVRN